MNVFSDQRTFMTACGQSTDHWNHDQVMLYRKLIEEEYEEFQDALDNGDTVEAVDACIDMVYVIAGFLHSHGFQPEALWAEVQRSNLSKIDAATGKVVRREGDGKILKPATFSPPNLRDIVESQLAAQRGREELRPL